MGKSNKKRRQNKPHPRERTAKKNKGPLWTWMVAFGLAVIGVGGGYSYYRFMQMNEVDAGRGLRAEPRTPSRPWKRVEQRPVLPADFFVGTVRQAYAEAKRIPEVLDRLYCYCQCKEGHGHKTLLTCYTVTHAST